MAELALEPAWPVEEGKQAGLYFYLEATEAYAGDTRFEVADHGEMLMFGGYSYLSLNGHPAITAAAMDAIATYGTGTHGVRLLAGTLRVHRDLERRIAEFKGTEAAATFSSGYFANVSAIAALMGRHDAVICDRLDHASIVDGCMLSGATVERYRHNDLDHLDWCLQRVAEAERRLVIVDGVFSMDGDIVDLPGVVETCRRHGATLMVDEAHSVGVLGETGHGIEEHFGMPADTVDIKMGTLSKAIPSVGGYIAGSSKLITFLQHQARGFIYSAALPPASAAAAMAALDVIEAEPERVQRLRDNRALMVSELERLDIPVPDTGTPILPVMCGYNWPAWRLANACHRRGIYIQAIPHPVVPKGKARLRLAVNAAHTPEEIVRCATVLREAADEVGMFPLRDAVA
ncbi:MAG: aminotransferase class I/II-fold pyridoxal phosphate-dependent enzyme [Thermoleophilia bacterium]